jgi:hypothetical protein
MDSLVGFGREMVSRPTGVLEAHLGCGTFRWGERHDRFGAAVGKAFAEPWIEGRFAKEVGSGMASGRRSADRQRRAGDRRFCPRAGPHPFQEVR